MGLTDKLSVKQTASRVAAFAVLPLGCVQLALIRPACAQNPGAINPGLQLQEQLREAAPPPPAFDPTAPPQKEMERQTDAEKDQMSPDASRVLLLRGVRFSGNSVISADRLMEPFAKLIGADIAFSDLRQAALNAEAIYKQRGYITTRVLIPEQDFASGEIVIDVVEGYIQKIDVKGASAGLQKYTQKMLRPVVSESTNKIFDFNVLERQLLLIRDFGGLTYNVTLSPGIELGASILTVDLKQESFSGSAMINNYVPEQLGSVQLGGQLQYITSTAQPVKALIGGSYAFPYSNGLITGLGLLSTPIGHQGFSAEAFWAGSSTESKDLFAGPGNLQTEGNSNYWSLGISYPLILERNSKLSITLRGTGQNSSNDLTLDNIQMTNLSTDKIRALRLAVDGYYVTSTSTNLLAFQLSQGVGGLDSGLGTDEFPSNPNGDPNFTSAKLNLSTTQRLFNTNALLTAKLAGQVSSSPLPLPEQFTYGGPQYGRAFNSVYLLGDQGWAGSLELAHPFTFTVSSKPFTISPFIWYDYGQTTYLEGPFSGQTASTYGIGLRGNGFYNTTFEVGWGIPATNSLQPNVEGTSSSIVYFNVGVKF